MLKSPRHKVWAALVDPQVLEQCTPGCKELELTDESTFKVVMELGVAGVKGVYEGQIQLSDIVPEISYKATISGEGLLGFIKGEGIISLESVGDDTKLSYILDSHVGGKLAGVGQRVMGGVAKMMVGKFFGSLEKVVQT